MDVLDAKESEISSISQGIRTVTKSRNDRHAISNEITYPNIVANVRHRATGMDEMGKVELEISNVNQWITNRENNSK